MTFSISTANRILDSLESNNDWRTLYAIRTAQYNNKEKEVERFLSLDSLSVVQLARCDSVTRDSFSKERAAITENETLRTQVRNSRFWTLAGTVVGFILGVVLVK